MISLQGAFLLLGSALVAVWLVLEIKGYGFWKGDDE